MSLMELRNQLCQSAEEFCRKCFLGTGFEKKQNPPNVFRVTKPGVSIPLAFIFDKPNDNTNLRCPELVPITIYDDRIEVDNCLPRAPSHSRLIRLCEMLGLIPSDSNCLDSSNFYITNAVKCDMCCMTGKSGRIKINNKQAATCREQFLVRELLDIDARALVFFGKNAQRFALGETTPLWSVSIKKLKERDYFVLRVPHTSPISFNTHGGKGINYIAPFMDFFRQANIQSYAG